MKVITLNVNGVRAAARKGFFDWLASQQADVICLQETKAHETQLTDPVFHPEGYHCYYYDAEKKGYSGVALFCRQQPLAVTRGLGWPCADQEGRYIQADFADVSVASLYLPSGTSGDERQTLKYDFLDRFAPYLQTLKQNRPNLILCGDWNIAHKAIDLKNWRANQKHSGFLPEERAWMDKLFDSLGFVDAFRVINPQPDQYTWWSNRGQAWAKNVGWRIDYQIITPGLADKVERAEIYKEQRFSDHAPLTIEYA
jgi:exodeoxyribonuclease-3